MFLKKSLVAVAVLSLTACATVNMPRALAPRFQNPTRSLQLRAQSVSQEIIVKFKSRPTPEFLKQYAQQNQLQFLKISPLGAALFRKLPSAKNQTLQSFSQNKMVAYTQNNIIYRHFQQQAAPDPLAPEQYGLDMTGLKPAWQINPGRSETVIAIVDTGVDLGHPDLKNKLVTGFNAIDQGQSPPRDENGHGTHCAGVAAAETGNQVGIAGACPNCKIMPIKALDREGGGTGFDVANGIVWATDHGAKVISLSLGGPGEDQTLTEAIDYAIQKGTVVVAAAGNFGTPEKNYPAAYPAVIAVGAVNPQAKRAGFSSYGNWVSVVSPGTDIMSTMPSYSVFMNEREGYKNHYDFMDGTSMAAPLVAGIAGLLVSHAPDLNPIQVKAVLESRSQDLGDPAYDSEFGYGLIHAQNALANPIAAPNHPLLPPEVPVKQPEQPEWPPTPPPPPPIEDPYAPPPPSNESPPLPSLPPVPNPG